MRALVLSTCYPKRTRPDHGIFIHRQIRALADLGVECEVLQPVDWAPPAPLHRLHPGWRAGYEQLAVALDEVDGIRVHHPRVYHPKPSRFFPGDPWERMGRAVAGYVARRGRLRSADLIYAHFLCHEGYAGLVAARRLGMPLVAIARGDDVHAWPERWPDRATKLAEVLASADGLLATSHGLARDAAAWATRGLSTPIEVVYNGIDTERFRPAADDAERRDARRRIGLPEDGRVLLSVATPIAIKGWPELLDAFALLGAEEWRLAMAGSPRNADDLDLEAEARARGVGSRATWLGCLPPEAMPDLYRAADAFVLASHNEGLSNAVLEAMATGLPVVATDVGGHAEVVEDGVTGRLVPPKDAHALSLALESVLFDGDEAARIGRAARLRAVALGDPLANAARLVDHFERVLGARRAAASVAMAR
jgi:teichuronic acid biosynthesis glycosyltransferase TuaC